MTTLLAREALKVVYVSSRSHDHLEGRNGFVARRAVSGASEQPQVIPLAEYQVRFGVQARSNLAEATVATGAL